MLAMAPRTNLESIANGNLADPEPDPSDTYVFGGLHDPLVRCTDPDNLSSNKNSKKKTLVFFSRKISLKYFISQRIASIFLYSPNKTNELIDLIYIFSVCYRLVIVKIRRTKLNKFGQRLGSDLKRQGFNLII